MKEKKIKKAVLEQITYSDVLEAIKKWNEDDVYLLLQKSNKKSKKYFLEYENEVYSSKPIFAVAYYVHFGEIIDTDKLIGGISSNGVAKHLMNLGFKIKK